MNGCATPGPTLYTYLLDKEMMFYEQENGLKGQYNLAQGNPGKTGSRPGLENGHENRPCENVYQGETLVSDEGDGHFFPDNDVLQFRPKRFFCFVHRIFADGFSSSSFTRGDVSVRSSLNLPRAELHWPFRPGNIMP